MGPTFSSGSRDSDHAPFMMVYNKLVLDMCVQSEVYGVNRSKRKGWPEIY